MPRVTFRVGAFSTAVLVPLLGCGPSAGTSPAPSPSGGTSPEISAADLRNRLYAYADDSMQGRRSGTPGNVKATDLIAAEARRLGLEPAGEKGTWFQTVPIVTRTLEPGAGLTVDGAPAGAVNRAQTTERFNAAAGIVVATLDGLGPSDRLDLQDPGGKLASGKGPVTPAFMYATARVAEALLGARPSSLRPGAAGKMVSGKVGFADRPAPSPARNVVAILRGDDPALRGQMVAVGAHNDHDGISPETLDHDSLRAFNRVMRPEGANSTPGEPTAEQHTRIRVALDSLRRERPARPDSVLNGADDDGSGSVGLLEIAEHLAKSPDRPARSVLFVWHTAEEMGLLGADWFTRNPTVPRDSIVAQLNVDMIGRGGRDDRPDGGPAYLQIIGSRRLATELGDLVDRVNAEGRHGFEFDYQYDADGHPDNYYCRSDHYMYARFGIPIAFFSSGSHRDYHQLTDEAQYIDYDKLARVTRLIGDVASAVADLDHRIVVDKPKPDPEGVCKQ